MPFYSLLVRGRVQGVGFRAYCAREAQRMKINGFVRNLKDGRVEVVCEVDESQLADFQQLIQQGPRYSKVEELLISECAATELEQGFQILRDL